MARYARVSSISFPGVGGGPDRLKNALSQVTPMIEQAAADKPDIIALPETFNALGQGEKEWLGSAESVPGPTTDAVAKLARKYSTYIACPILEETRIGPRNAVILLDRKGRVAWKYYKYVPTIGEMEGGIVPGTSTETFETDFGRIGAIICFDLNFFEILEGYRRNRPEIIFFCSMFRGGLIARMWAFMLHCFVATSTPGENSLIINPLGRILAESSSYNRVIFSCLDLDCAVVHIDYNHDKYLAMKRKYKDKVEIEILSPEARTLISSHHRTKTVHDLVAEYKLELVEDYFDRARAVREKVLRKRR